MKNPHKVTQDTSQPTTVLRISSNYLIRWYSFKEGKWNREGGGKNLQACDHGQWNCGNLIGGPDIHLVRRTIPTWRGGDEPRSSVWKRTVDDPIQDLPSTRKMESERRTVSDRYSRFTVTESTKPFVKKFSTRFFLSQEEGQITFVIGLVDGRKWI